MAIPGLVAARGLADAENKEAVWDNLGNNINAVILATNFIRNNTMVGAVAGTPGTPPTNWQIANVGTGIIRQIVGVGVEDGIAYVDVRYSGIGSNNPIVQITPETATGIASSAGQVWTASYYLRLVGGTLTGVTLWQTVWAERAASGAFLTAVTTPGQSAPTSLALSAQRRSVVRTLTNADAVHLTNRLQISCANDVAIDFTLRVGMPQMQQGGYLTPPIATTNAAASALATVPLAIQGDDILELAGARLAATSDFVRIKGLATPAQPRLTAAAANTASGTALRDNALFKASPSSEGDYFLSRGTLDGQSLRVNGLNIASLSGSPFSGDTASCPLLISSFSAPTNLRINNAMASGTLAFPEKAIPIETDQFIFYAKAGQG